MNKTENLMRTAAKMAIEIYNLENGDNAREVSLGTTIDIDGKEAYAFTKNSIVFWDGSTKDFADLNDEDILAISQAINDEYGVEL
jgi:hypothetical protein